LRSIPGTKQGHGSKSENKKRLVVVTAMLLLKPHATRQIFLALKRIIRAGHNQVYPLASDGIETWRKRAKSTN
jgi:hypothetical protein